MFIFNKKTLKLITLIITVYFVIGALHGIAPGLWKKSFGGAEGKGPFRILIFTPLLVLFFFVVCFLDYIWEKSCLSKPKTCYPKIFHEPYSRRGPPLS